MYCHIPHGAGMENVAAVLSSEARCYYKRAVGLVQKDMPTAHIGWVRLQVIFI